MTEGASISRIHRLLLGRFGPQGWWPGDSPAEIAIGALLTQSVSWRNAERAVRRLDEATGLSLRAIQEMPSARLEEALRPSRFYRQKAARLRTLAGLVDDAAHGSLDLFLARPWPMTRPLLLGLNGVGEETADAILVYAGSAPLFVVDAYARRVFRRVGLGFPHDRALKDAVTRALPGQVELQEFHALIDTLGHRICKREPRCAVCPLVLVCSTGRRATLGGEAEEGIACNEGAPDPSEEDQAQDGTRQAEGAHRGGDRACRQTQHGSYRNNSLLLLRLDPVL